MVGILGPSPQFITPSGSAKAQPLVAVASTGKVVVRSAEIIELPADAIGRKRLQRVAKLAQACGDQSPDLKARHAKQTEKRVEGLPNVVEIEYRSGHRVWFLRYTDPLTGARTSIRLGAIGSTPYIDMVAQAKRWQDDVAEGRSPKAAKMTVDTFVETEVDPWAREHLRSYKGFLANYWNDISPLIGGLSLGDVRPIHGDRMITFLREGNRAMRRGKLANAAINRKLMAARTIFRLAVERGYISENPLRGTRQLKETPPSPKALEPEQLSRFFAAMAGESLSFMLLIELSLATAARINEILELQYDDIDRANGVLHLCMTKAGEPQTLPLTSSVDAILIRLESLRRPDNPHLLPAKRGDGHMAAPYKILHKVLAAAGLERAGFHLFRKTVATQAMTRIPGMDALTVSRLLRHKSIRTLEVHYLATPQQRLRQAANDIGALLQADLHG